MQSLTLSIALVAGLLILFVKPIKGLVIYLAVIFFYPSYLVVSAGSVELTAHRMIVCVLLLKCLFNFPLMRKFKWRQLDTWVTVYIGVCTLVMCLTLPLGQALVNRSGYIIDAWFLYLIVRFCVVNRSDIFLLAKWVGIFLVPVAIMGVMESVTGYQPFAKLAEYSVWDASDRSTVARFGLTRAVGIVGQPIMFGLCFATLLPLVYFLRHRGRKWRMTAYILSGFLIMGSLSSMSGGPLATLGAVFICLLLENFKRYVKPLLILLAAAVILVAIISNRPVYHVIASYANPLGGAGWHRAKLIDFAIEDFNKWYLLGFRGQDPGWGQRIGSDQSDITNEFIWSGVRFGIWGVIALCLALVSALHRVILLFRRSKDPLARSYAWALGTVIISLILTFLSVNIFGQMILLYYFILGLIGSSSAVLTVVSRNNRSLLLPAAATRNSIPRRISMVSRYS